MAVGMSGFRSGVLDVVDEAFGRSAQGFEDIPSLLLGSGDDGAQYGEVVGVAPGAEAAGDFLSQLHHAQVALGLIVGEGHLRVGEEAQRLVSAPMQAQGEVVALAPFRFPTLAGRAQRRQALMKGHRLDKQHVVAPPQGTTPASQTRNQRSCMHDAPSLPGDEAREGRIPGAKPVHPHKPLPATTPRSPGIPPEHAPPPGPGPPSGKAYDPPPDPRACDPSGPASYRACALSEHPCRGRRGEGGGGPAENGPVMLRVLTRALCSRHRNADKGALRPWARWTG